MTDRTDFLTAGAAREAGGWHRGKQWSGSGHQGALVTGPTGRGAGR